MRLVFYIAHPAQYHFYKHITKKLKNKGYQVFFVIKSKDILEELLKADGVEFINILPEGRRSTRLGILIGLIKRDIRLYKIIKQLKPHLIIGSDPSCAHVGKILNIPSMIFIEDDFSIIKELAYLTYPFASHIIAPQPCDCGHWNYKKIAYNGYMKLAYLHPNYFHPKRLDIEDYILIRFSSLNAYHDRNIQGISFEFLDTIIQRFSEFAQIKIISEKKIPPHFSKYILNISPINIHHYLFNCKLFISDSQSMSVEAAMLGVPSIRISDFSGKISVLEELEKRYALTFGFKPIEHSKILDKIDEIINTRNLNNLWKERRNRMLKEKIDVTDHITKLIENYTAKYYK